MKERWGSKYQLSLIDPHDGIVIRGRGVLGLGRGRNGEVKT